MKLFFSGIGGTGLGPLALIAHQAGYEVSGSDKQNSAYIEYLRKRRIKDIGIGQDGGFIRDVHESQPIDWLVYSSAVSIENPDHPELVFARENNIRTSKRDDLLNQILSDKNLKMIAIAGTHGKTTTTAMVIWVFKQLGIPISYSVGAKISFGDMGHYDPKSEYFVYECDEYDRNFLSFNPEIAIIPGIDYDHPDIYPTREEYYKAFSDFFGQSKKVYAHPEDYDKIGLAGAKEGVDKSQFVLAGEVNRANAQLVVEALADISGKSANELIDIMNKFPGVSRRFEKIADNIYTDYAHTPEKIRGALQLAHEVAGDNVAVVYEGLHNTRQHFIKDDLVDLFDGVKKLYVVPSYLAREDKDLELLTPEKLCEIIKKPDNRRPAQLDADLKTNISNLASQGTLVLCLTAGGGNSLDEWLRRQFVTT